MDGRDHDRHAVVDESDMADQRLVQDGADDVELVAAALRMATQFSLCIATLPFHVSPHYSGVGL